MEETPGRASLEKLGCRTPPQLHAGGVDRQQQHNNHIVEKYSSTGLVMAFARVCCCVIMRLFVGELRIKNDS